MISSPFLVFATSFVLLIKQANDAMLAASLVTFILLVFPAGPVHGAKVVQAAAHSTDLAAIFKIL